MQEQVEPSIQQAGLTARVLSQVQYSERRREKAWGHLALEMHNVLSVAHEVIGVAEYSKHASILDRRSYEEIQKECVAIADALIKVRQRLGRLESRRMRRGARDGEDHYEQPTLDG